MLVVVANTHKLSNSEYDSHDTDKNILSQLYQYMYYNKYNMYLTKVYMKD